MTPQKKKKRVNNSWLKREKKPNHPQTEMVPSERMLLNYTAAETGKCSKIQHTQEYEMGNKIIRQEDNYNACQSAET